MKNVVLRRTFLFLFRGTILGEYGSMHTEMSLLSVYAPKPLTIPQEKRSKTHPYLSKIRTSTERSDCRNTEHNTNKRKRKLD